MTKDFVQYRAGDRAALTKALEALAEAGNDNHRKMAAARVAEIINRAPEKGFKQDEIIEGRHIPDDVLPLIRRSSEIAKVERAPTGRANQGARWIGRHGQKPGDEIRTRLTLHSVANRPDEMSDDTLEPEVDVEQPTVGDDRPVIGTPRDWTITSLREKWEGGLLDLQPDYQREYVWQLKPELPSRLIESILLEIPIPPIYFGLLAGGKFEVIDGQQRLTTLLRFVSNEFELQKLNRMPSLNGKDFRQLSKENQEKIKDTPIRTITIDAGNRSGLRFEIFERLNRGSMTLNEQELRNCVYRGPFNALLAELEMDGRWRKIKGGDMPEPRFKEREMILRFLAFANRVNFYNGALKRFLNDYMEKYAPSDAAAIDEQAKMFRQTMQNVITVFGHHSGRLYSVQPGSNNGGWGQQFSIAALEIQASALLGCDAARVQKVADQIREQFVALLLTNEEICKAISQATNTLVHTKIRWTLFASQI